jgi:hypothetical protein
MQSRFAQRVFAFGLVAGIGLAVASCGSEAEVSGLYDHNYLSTCDKWPIARCEVDADCYSGLVYELGTRCIDGHCLCPVDGMIMCNRKDHPPENNMRGCYFPVDCEPGEMCVAEEAPPPPPPAPECTAEDLSKCPGPPDKRCGVATCEEGVCGIAITPGPIASQRAGDCKRSVCTFEGIIVEEEDASDYYDDGRECTFDMCVDGAYESLHLQPVTCPEKGEGVCSEGGCVQCINDSFCNNLNEACVWGRCIPNTCANGKIDPNETDVDCGGACTACASGKACALGAHCKSKVCVNNQCQEPTCDDKEKNDGETGVDCGTACNDPAKLCSNGQGCATGEDCQSKVCWAGKCQAPSCTDGVQNSKETGIDCGGGPPCPEC